MRRCGRSFFLLGLVVLFSAAILVGQQTNALSAPDDKSDEVVPLSACSCGDLPRLQDRLQKLKAVELLIANTLQSTAAGKPASRQDWSALQSQIKGYLRAMEIQGLTTFPDVDLFNGNTDPFCGTQLISAGACLDQDFAVHQTGHDDSCRAQNWNWQTAWSDDAMLKEEAAAVEKEIDVIKETIKHLGCGGTQEPLVGTPPPVQPNQACPQFMIVVQNVTTTAINVPGGLTERSGRSLNNGQGIPVPLTFHDDDTFEGFGSGMDTGSAAGTIPSESAKSQFGHTQDIAASGIIQPGSCATQPCQPDVMHLVLLGGPSQQTIQGQARGAYNGNIQRTTPTGGARLEFDLPAYIGGSAQKTFFSTPILNSGMTVNLIQANNGTSALPQGSSLLYAMQQCKAGIRAPVASSGGAAGVVTPGLEGMSTVATNKPVPRVQTDGGGIIIPGLENRNPPVNSAIWNVVPGLNLSMKETIHIADEPIMPISINVQEGVHVHDAVGVFPPLSVNANETIHVTDVVGFYPPLSVNVNETVHVFDSLTSAPKGVRTPIQPK